MTDRQTGSGGARALLAALLLLWAAHPPVASAAESAQAEPPAAARDPAGAGASTPAEPGPAQAEAADSPEVFVPTEDISEDFAVSFPVDI